VALVQLLDVEYVFKVERIRGVRPEVPTVGSREETGKQLAESASCGGWLSAAAGDGKEEEEAEAGKRERPGAGPRTSAAG